MAEKDRRIPILFHERPDQTPPVTLPVEDFAENTPVPFTEADASRLMADYDELASQGYRGALQVVHQRGSSGFVIPDFMPQQWVDKHLTRLFMLNPGQSLDGIDPERDIVVTAGLDGSMTQQDQAKLADAMRDRVGVFGGGGDAHPLDKQYVHEMKAWEQALQAGTPIVAECLTHEMMGELLRTEYGSSEGVVPGTLELLTSVVDVTEAGREHPVFSRTDRNGKGFVTMVGNWYHLQADNPDNDRRPAGRVLGRNRATGYPVAYEIDAAQPRQVTSYQYHPYHPLGAEHGAAADFVVPASTKPGALNRDLVVPANRAHPTQVELAEYLAGDFGKLNREHGIHPEDVQALFDAGITAKALGVDFYGPVFQSFADRRLGRR